MNNNITDHDTPFNFVASDYELQGNAPHDGSLIPLGLKNELGRIGAIKVEQFTGELRTGRALYDGPRYRRYYFGAVGTVASFECPVKAISRAIENGHKLWYVNASCSVLSGDGIDHDADRVVGEIREGALVALAGRLFVLRDAPNGNFRLVQLDAVRLNDDYYASIEVQRFEASVPGKQYGEVQSALLEADIPYTTYGGPTAFIFRVHASNRDDLLELIG